MLYLVVGEIGHPQDLAQRLRCRIDSFLMFPENNPPSRWVELMCNEAKLAVKYNHVVITNSYTIVKIVEILCYIGQYDNKSGSIDYESAVERALKLGFTSDIIELKPLNDSNTKPILAMNGSIRDGWDVVNEYIDSLNYPFNSLVCR